jgi:hypothetical protein
MVRALKLLALFAPPPVSLYDELLNGEKTIEHCRAGNGSISWAQKLCDLVLELLTYLLWIAKWIEGKRSENNVSALSCQVVNEYPVGPVVLDLSPLSPWSHWKASRRNGYSMGTKTHIVKPLRHMHSGLIIRWS